MASALRRAPEPGTSPSMYARLTRAVDLLARAMAYAGGLVLVALVAMTCLSIAGRALVSLGLMPIRGDFELIEIGAGFAIFAFLPWCQFNRGHAVVDLLKPAIPTAMNRVIDLAADLGMAAAAAILAWRLWLGMLDKLRYGETTFILQFPVWIAYAAAAAGAVVFVIVSLYCVLRSARVLLGHPDETARHV